MTTEIEKILERDMAITKKALEKVSIAPPKRSHLRRIAEDFLEMARSYYEDTNYFRDKGELEKALANINYAHGWLDAGARLGLFDVGEDDQLFTLAEGLSFEDAGSQIVHPAPKGLAESAENLFEFVNIPMSKDRVAKHGHGC